MCLNCDDFVRGLLLFPCYIFACTSSHDITVSFARIFVRNVKRKEGSTMIITCSSRSTLPYHLKNDQIANWGWFMPDRTIYFLVVEMMMMEWWRWNSWIPFFFLNFTSTHLSLTQSCCSKTDCNRWTSPIWALRCCQGSSSSNENRGSKRSSYHRIC